MGDQDGPSGKRTRIILITIVAVLAGMLCGLGGTLAIVLVRLAHVAVRLGQ